MPWPWWTQQRQEADSYLDSCTGNEHRKAIKKVTGTLVTMSCDEFTAVLIKKS